MTCLAEQAAPLFGLVVFDGGQRVPGAVVFDTVGAAGACPRQAGPGALAAAPTSFRTQKPVLAFARGI